MERMLILAPHIDDAEFGLGGWINRAWRDKIGEARVVVAFGGNSYGRSDGMRVTYENRLEEMKDAMAELGVIDWASPCWFPENSGHTVDYPRLVDHITKAVNDYLPTEVFVCLPSFNQDHRALFDATITAFRPGELPFVKHVWAYEYPGNAWGYERPLWGRAYLELRDYDVAAKMAALRAHKSQFDGRKVAVAPEAAHAMMVQRGAEVGMNYAECVYLLRETCRLTGRKEQT